VNWHELILPGEVLAGLAVVVVVCPPLRRVARALWQFSKARTPKWLLPILGVCLFVPGPFDELAVLAVVLVPVLRRQADRRELVAAVSAAWKG
jgi:hypothetical protein